MIAIAAVASFSCAGPGMTSDKESDVPAGAGATTGPANCVQIVPGVPLKGIVLAGGTGSRLFPLTKITNKHLLPIYDKPMIFYPIQTLVGAWFNDILPVTGG